MWLRSLTTNSRWFLRAVINQAVKKMLQVPFFEKPNWLKFQMASPYFTGETLVIKVTWFKALSFTERTQMGHFTWTAESLRSPRGLTRFFSLAKRRVGSRCLWTAPRGTFGTCDVQRTFQYSQYSRSRSTIFTVLSWALDNRQLRVWRTRLEVSCSFCSVRLAVSHFASIPLNTKRRPL
jgi:hypothetical protein